MGVLDWLKGSISTPAELPENPRADVDWKALEEALVRSIKSQISEFAAVHGDEVFYAFALDCNADYANVLFCLNTLESLDASTREYVKSNDPDEIASQKEDLEWGLGDWKYQGFNLESALWPDQVPMLEDFAELPNSEDIEAFLVTCCRALILAEREGAFASLPRTSNFRVACIDHDEDAHAGEERLERVRASS